MSFFNLFKRKDQGPKVSDLVWMHTKAKFQGALDLLRKTPDTIVLYWFSDTGTEFEQLLRDNAIDAKLKNANHITPYEVDGHAVIFLEHHPMRSKEDLLMQAWTASSISVLSALDEPFFLHFGGERIVELMKKMGMEENEAIEHSLVSKSIQNAQQKLEENVYFDGAARSAAEWIRLNVKKGSSEDYKG